MEDIQQLIKAIVSNPRIASGSNFASKVYRDEPILFTAPQMARYTPPRIREMRRLARGDMYGAGVFYDQAKFMEDFEDDFDYKGDFTHYFPTYQHMTDIQLRGYFTWRKCVRAGVVEQTSLSFAFVYLYELLNGIGVSSPEEGFHTLHQFWQRYREYDTRLDSYAAAWLRDMVVYHNLDASLLDGLPDTDVDQAVAVLLAYREHGADAVFSSLNSLSSYNFETSKFYQTRPDDVKKAVYRVFADVSAYYDKCKNKSASEQLFGRICTSSYTMFKSAVFLPVRERESRVYPLGNWQRFICTDGDWSLERFVWYGKKNTRIGAILKMVDYLLREQYGYKSSLQPPKMNKVLRGKIEKSLASHERDRKANIPPTIAIDVHKLHGIRAAALATQSKLLVEEMEKMEAVAAAAPVTNDSPPQEKPGSSPGLSEVEVVFLTRLLAGEAFSDLLHRHRLLPSVLVDAINEKLFDEIGDTAIVEGIAGPEVLEDYHSVLKGIIGQ
ncbi:MAG: TerB N-terminal domain-containing protein [Planctomycetaceae bacterium]|nr:TerB N-terminal domain-containing protein [Planctomycetaceae bacterium]